MLPQNAFDQDINPGLGALTKGLVDRDALARVLDEFRGDDFKIVFAHAFECTVVCWQGVIESDLVLIQAEIDARLIGFLPLFLELDQLFDDFLRRDRAIVIFVERLFVHLGELAALNEAALGADANLVTEKFLE